MRSLLYRVLPSVLVVFRLFFDRRYLTGRHFEKNFNGLRWCIRAVWQRNILRLAPPLPFPAALTCTVSNPRNIHFSPNDIDNFQSGGTYFQNFRGSIYLGEGVMIAPNVGIITANHDFQNLLEHSDAEDVHLGDRCWIGMNSVILPGVTLGSGTVVGAGSVVTKSFPDGNCVIAGVPAKVIKKLD